MRNDKMMNSSSLNDETKIIYYKWDLFHDKSWRFKWCKLNKMDLGIIIRNLNWEIVVDKN